MKNIRYELYFRTFTEDGKIEMESITKYKFKTLEEAQQQQTILNRNLKYKGYNDRKYIILKITREYIEE